MNMRVDADARRFSKEAEQKSSPLQIAPPGSSLLPCWGGCRPAALPIVRPKRWKHLSLRTNLCAALTRQLRHH